MAGAVISSTLRINLLEDVTKNGANVAAALDKVQKHADALRASLARSGLTDRMQAELSKIGAEASHVDALSQSWRRYTVERGLAGKADKTLTAAEIADLKNWEKQALAVEGVMMAAEVARLKDRQKLAAEASAEVVRIAERERAQKLRIADQEVRDRQRVAEAEVAAANRQAAQTRALREEASAGRRMALGIAAGFAAHETSHFVHRSVETYREFDKERRYGRAVMGISDQQQEPLVKQAVDLGARTKYNDIQVLEAQRDLAARGLKRDQILGMMPAAADLGQALGISLPEAVKQMEGAIFGFKKTIGTTAEAAASARQTADIQVRGAKMSGMTPDDLREVYKYGATPARLAGVSEQTLLAFGAISKKANIGGDEAGVAFRALISAATAPTRGAKEALLANGLDYAKYQKPIERIDTDAFTRNVAAQYGVKLGAGARGALDRIFHDKAILNDPALFTPAVTKVLRRILHGNDAKSLKSIARMANRFRASSSGGADVNAFIADLIEKMSGKGGLALANAVFGAKQGGRIANALGDKEVMQRFMDLLKNHAAGYAADVSGQRMAGFDGAASRLEGSIKNLESAIGRAFDNDGKGGFLTFVTDKAGQFAQTLATADPYVQRLATEAGLAAAAFAGFKGFEALSGGFGLKGAGVALTEAARELMTAARLETAGAEKMVLAGAAGAEKAVVAGAAGGVGKIAKTIPLVGTALVAAEVAADGLGAYKKANPKLFRGGARAEAAYRSIDAANGDIKPTSPAAPTGHWEGGAYAKGGWHGRKWVLDAPPPPIAGARASGGPVSAGKTYLVGEHGPELFTPGLAGAISTADVQRLLSRATLVSGGADPQTAAAVRAMAFQLAGAVDGVARAIDRLDAAGLRGTPGQDGFDGTSGGSGGGNGNGRRGFMMRHGHFGGGAPYNAGRRGFMVRHGDFAPQGDGLSAQARAGLGSVESGRDAFTLSGPKHRGDGIRPIDPTAFSGKGVAAETLVGGPGFNTRGVKNRNPGNIGWGKWAKEHGAVGGAGSDTGHLVAVFPSFDAGYKAMRDLAAAKYAGGARSMDQLIAGRHGWTPGNHAAAANVARSMGIGPNDDAGLDRPAMMERFQRALSAQELGPNGAKYALARAADSARAIGPFGVGGFNLPNAPAVAAGAPRGGIFARSGVPDGGKLVGGANLMSGGHWKGAVPGENLTTITLKDGHRLTVNADAAPSFQRFFNGLVARGYNIKSIAGYAPRPNRSNGARLSEHAFGNAVDVNPFKYGNGYHDNKTDLPPGVSRLAAENGLSWGGDWRHRDNMHFEWRGVRPWEKGRAPAAAAAKPIGETPTRADLVRSNEDAYRSAQNPFLSHKQRDDPLGLRRSPEAGAPEAGKGLRDGLSALDGKRFAPAVDTSHLDAAEATIDRIHHKMDRIHTASERHRGGLGPSAVAGLGSRLRGGFAHSGAQIG